MNTNCTKVFLAFVTLGVCLSPSHAQVRSRNVQKLIELLKDTSKDRKLREDVARELGYQRDKAKGAVPFLLEEFERENAPGNSSFIGAVISIGPEAVPELLKAWSSAEGTKRRNVLYALSRIQPPTEASLQVALQALREDKDLALRVEVAEALGWYAAVADKVLPGLLQAAKDKDAEVRGAAATSLSRLKSLAAQVLPVLITLSKDADQGVRSRAIEGLGRMEKYGKEVLPILHGAVKEAHPTVRVAGLRGLRSFWRLDSSVLATVIKSMSDENEDVREAAVDSLFVFEGKEARTVARALTLALKDPSAKVRAAATSQLGSFHEHDDLAIPALLEALKDKNPEVRRLAVNAVSRFIAEQARVVIPALAAALQDAHKDVRAEILTVLSNHGSSVPRAQAKLIVPPVTALLKDGDPIIRAHAVDALRGLRPDATTLPHMLALAKDPDATVRASVCRGTCGFLDQAKTVGPILRQALTDSEGGVRFEAVLSLRHFLVEAIPAMPTLRKMIKDDDGFDPLVIQLVGLLGPNSRELVSDLLPALKDEDSRTRGDTAEALGNIGADPKSVIPALILRLRDEREVRQKAIIALGNFGTDARAALPALKEAFQEKDEFIRGAAAEALIAIDPTTATTFPGLAGVVQKSPRKAGQVMYELLQALTQISLLREKGQHVEAMQLLEKAFAKVEEMADPRTVLPAVFAEDLAEVYGAGGQHSKAEAMWHRSIHWRERHHGTDHPEVAKTRAKLAFLYYQTGRFDQAEKLAQECLYKLEAKLGKDHADLMEALNTLGLLYRQKGDGSKAEKTLMRCMRIGEEEVSATHPSLTVCRNNLALVYTDAREFSKAEDLYLQSLKWLEMKHGPEHPAAAIMLSNLATLHMTRGDPAKAETLLSRALKLVENEKDGTNRIRIMNNLVSVYMTRGDSRNAGLMMTKLGLAVSMQGSNEVLMEMMHTSGTLAITQGHDWLADFQFNLLLKLARSDLGPYHPSVAKAEHNLAVLHVKRKQYSQAEELFWDSLGTIEMRLGADHPGIAHSLTNLAVLNGLQARWDESWELAGRSRRIMHRYVTRVLPGLPDPEQQAFLRTSDEDVFGMVCTIALARSADEKAAALSAEWVLNRKAMGMHILKERAATARASADPGVQKLVDELRRVREELAFWCQRGAVAKDQQDVGMRLTDLAKKERELNRQLGLALELDLLSDPWVEVKTIRQALPKNAVLVTFAKVNVWNFLVKKELDPTAKPQPHYAAWILPPAGQDSIRLFDLGPADRIDDAVKAFRRAINSSAAALEQETEAESEKVLRAHLENISDLVFAPIRSHVDKAERLILSPDAALWLFPWEALPGKDGTYLLEKYRINYLVNDRDLATAGLRAANGAAVIVADPDFDLNPEEVRKETERLTPGGPRGGGPASRDLGGPKWSALPGSAAEAQAIAPALQKLTGMAPEVYARHQALEGVMKSLRQPRILVASTHAFFIKDQSLIGRADQPGIVRPMTGLEKPVWENPLLRCGLVLAGANKRDRTQAGDDGILTGLEILGLDLRGTDLVVLSACETAVGETANSEGVVGLRQSFQLAGAQTVIASLWKVPDAETSELMTRFFANLSDGQSKGDALRNAQLTMLKARREKRGAGHPFFWAAFTVTGPADDQDRNAIKHPAEEERAFDACLYHVAFLAEIAKERLSADNLEDLSQQHRERVIAYLLKQPERTRLGISYKLIHEHPVVVLAVLGSFLNDEQRRDWLYQLPRQTADKRAKDIQSLYAYFRVEALVARARGDSFFAQAKYKDAVLEYTRAIKDRPEDRDSHIQRGLCYYFLVTVHE